MRFLGVKFCLKTKMPLNNKLIKKKLNLIYIFFLKKEKNERMKEKVVATPLVEGGWLASHPWHKGHPRFRGGHEPSRGGS